MQRGERFYWQVSLVCLFRALFIFFLICFHVICLFHAHTCAPLFNETVVILDITKVCMLVVVT